MVDKLLSLAALGGTITNVALLRRFLSGATIIIALTVISSLLAGALLIGALYLACRELMMNGLDAGSAMLVVTVAGCFILAACISITVIQLQKLRELSTRIFTMPVSPAVTRITGVAQGFISGLLSRQTARKPQLK
jgi:hypothetical protein